MGKLTTSGQTRVGGQTSRKDRLTKVCPNLLVKGSLTLSVEWNTHFYVSIRYWLGEYIINLPERTETISLKQRQPPKLDWYLFLFIGS
jgi:hypothetical protein